MQGRLTEIRKGLEDWESSWELFGKDEEKIKVFNKIYFKLPSPKFFQTLKFIQTSKLILNCHLSLERSGLVRIDLSSAWPKLPLNFLNFLNMPPT